MKIVLHDGDRSRVVAMALSGEIDVGLGCFLRPVSGVRRTPLFRFSLMVIEPAARPRADRRGGCAGRTSSVAPDRRPAANPIQQLIDRNLQRFGAREPPDMVFDYFETQIAMVKRASGLRGHSDFAIPGLPPPQHCDAPAHGSHSADRALPDRESRQEAAARLRGLHHVPQELHRGMGEPWSPAFA